MTMQTNVNGRLRALAGCAAYLTIALVFIAGVRWLLPLPYWVLMLSGAGAHIAGRIAYSMVRNGRDTDDFLR
jgi:hypothetical protein